MLPGDLRAWLRAVEDRGELRLVRAARGRGEIGAASDLNLRAGSPAALLFDAIVDYPSGHRVLTGGCTWRAISRVVRHAGRRLFWPRRTARRASQHRDPD